MKLDVTKLKKVRHRGDRIIAACPACQEAGRDTDADNLVIFPDGRFACAANQGDLEHSRRILALAGNHEGPKVPPFKPRPPTAPEPPPKAINWMEDCAKLVSDSASLERLVQWRGYPPDYVTVLSGLGVLGLHEGRICFPVRGDAGQGEVMGRHVFSWPEERTGSSPKPDAWYNPAGAKPLTPLVIGWHGTATEATVMESQWDTLAVLYALGWDWGPSDMPLICTRGTSPTPALTQALNGVQTVRLWMQRDEPKADGSIPSEQWLARCLALLPESVTKIYRIDPPADFKDWNDAQRAMLPSDFAEAFNVARKGAVEVFRPSVVAEAAGASDELSAPLPLPEALPAVPPFNAERLLPPLLRAYVTDCAERLHVDASFIAVPLIVAIGSVLGNRIGLRPKKLDDWTEFANIWGAIVGRPSTLKSPALNEGMRPLRGLEKTANELHQAALVDWQRNEAGSKVKLSAAKSKALKAASKDQEFDAATLVQAGGDEGPACRRYQTNDASPESLHALLTQAPNASGIMIFQDELSGLLARLNDAERGAVLRAFMLSGWAGSQPAVVDRIGRGLNLRVDRCCISVLGGIQPGKLAPLVDGAVRESVDDDGWVQRLSLLVWPDAPADFKAMDRAPDREALTAVTAFFEKIEATQGQDFPGATFDESRGEYFLRLAPDASEAFAKWLEAETHALRSGDFSAAIESHFMKMRKTVCALALIFHLASEWDKPAVSLVCLVRALEWCEFLKAHALRVYGSGRNTTATAASRILQRLRTKALASTFTARELKRRAWSGLTDAKTVDSALDMLVDHGWLIPQERETQGRWTKDYTTHAAVFENSREAN